MMSPIRTVTFAVLVCVPSVGAAQPSPEVQPAAPASPPPDAKEVARARFQEGVRAYDERRYKDAVDLLLEADRAMHSPAFAYNIGIAYEAMGDVPSALRWLRTYLREVPQAEDRRAVEGRVSALEAKLQARGVQQATVLSTPDGATALIDGKPVGVTPWTGELLPGRHRLTVQLAVHQDHEQFVEVLAHRADDFLIALRPKASAEPVAPSTASAPLAPPPQPDDGLSSSSSSSASRVSPWTWAAFGGGVLALGGALAFEMSRASAEEEARKASQLDFDGKLDDAESRQTSARILAVVGGALVATGGVLLVLDLSSGPPARVTAGCSGTGCYATAGGSF